MITHAIPQISRTGEDAMLCTFTASDDKLPGFPLQQRLWQLCARLETERDALSLLEIVPGMGNLLLRWTQAPLAPCPFAVLQKHLQALWKETPEGDIAGRVIEIPVCYGGSFGPDLADVALHCGQSPEEVIRLHALAEYRVYCLGFQPGFAYLGGLDERLHTPRRVTPRLAIPSGSVAIGGSQTGVYPLATPGGWHIIGRTSLSLFDPAATPATLLQPGDTVRFVPESVTESLSEMVMS